MLLYTPPFLMVDQITIFPDHADPEAYYYLVSVPELVVEQNGDPSFWATAILPATSVTGGGEPPPEDVGRAIVSLDVYLPLPADGEEKLRKEIQKRWGREAKRLVPVTFQSGKASLTVARPQADQPSPEFFVYEGHSPSLIGDNRAAFALAAEGREAQALIAALRVGHLAGVMSYELEFPGLAPSFEASMVVHWDMVYKRFREREMTNGLFVTEEIDRTVESLKEGRDIQIEVKELSPEGAKAATKALFDELKSEAVKKLFEAPRPTGDVPIEERIGSGVREVLSSIVPGSHCALKTLTQNFLSTTTINLREQAVRLYKIYPQSTLAGLLARGGDAARRLQFVRLDDLPHRVEEIIVDMRPGANRLGVTGADVRVQARSPERDEPLLDQTVTLTTADTAATRLRFRRLGTTEPVVRYQAAMLLDPAQAPEGRERWSFDWRTVDGGRVRFDPEEWLDIAEIQIEVDDPAVFENGRVDMEVEAVVPDTGTVLRSAQLRFTKEAPATSFAVIVPEGRATMFRGREVFRRVGEPDFSRSVPSIDRFHRIMNPFGQSWTMEVRAVSAWTDTLALVVEFRVWDVARQTWLLSEQQFTKDKPVFTLRFATSPETPRRAEARTTRILLDGTPVRGPWRDLAGPVVGVNDQVKAERRIRGRLDVPHFVSVAVKKVNVELEYK
ncbi:MAG: hypothetical protein AB7F99_18230, partial [Vicinamibacterales bacterium]